MQALDEEYLNVDIQFAGLDQERLWYLQGKPSKVGFGRE